MCSFLGGRGDINLKGADPEMFVFISGMLKMFCSVNYKLNTAFRNLSDICLSESGQDI